MKQKSSKPFYLRWWFFVLVAIAIILILTALSGKGRRNKKTIDGVDANTAWANLELADLLPEPASGKVEIHTNTSDELWIDLNDFTEDDYQKYVSACKDKGFTVDSKMDSIGYDAYNSDGYKLELTWYKDSLSIELNAPVKLSAIQWPIGAAGQAVPTPKSLEGKFSYEYNDSFYVTIGNTSPEDFQEYVTTCAESGFVVDYDKGENYYYADNSDGYHLSLKYIGNNQMTIDVDAFDLTDSSDSETETPASTAAETEPAEAPETEAAANAETPAATGTPASGIRDDFKAAMDSYEAFINEYVDFINKYNANPTDLTLLSEYADYASKLIDMEAKFDQWNSDDLTNEELAYYLEVQTRVNQKLLEVGQ